MTPIQALQRRRASRARSPSPRHPNQLHVFEFCFGEGGLHRRLAAAIGRSVTRFRLTRPTSAGNGRIAEVVTGGPNPSQGRS